MVVHARAGGTIKIMGLMQGKFQGDSIIVMDAFALAVEGTETRSMPRTMPTSTWSSTPPSTSSYELVCLCYYSLDITYFKSSLDSHLLDLLWNKYWVNTLSSSPLLGNRDYVAGQIFDLEQVEGQLAHSRFGMLMPSQRKKEEGDIEYVEGDDIEMGDMDDMEDFEGFGDEDDNVKKLYIF
ncbi:hypothetical protein ZWY2020_032338 [Hordeum vulgare]|nr:hypothetical protein ZWY2020_032338 [Hordeum vulgare]